MDSTGDSRKNVTFDRRSLPGLSTLLLEGSGCESSNSSSESEDSRFSKFSRWVSCLDGQGMEEKDKTLLACVLLGIKELLHDKMVSSIVWRKIIWQIICSFVTNVEEDEQGLCQASDTAAS